MDIKILREKEKPSTYVYSFSKPLIIGTLSVEEKLGWSLARELSISCNVAEIKTLLYYKNEPDWLKLAFGHPILSGHCELNGVRTWELTLSIHDIGWNISLSQANKLLWRITPKHPRQTGTDVEIRDDNGVLALTIIGDDRAGMGNEMGTLLYPAKESGENLSFDQSERFLALCALVPIVDLIAVPFLGRANSA